jgi:hypothetical protein
LEQQMSTRKMVVKTSFATMLLMLVFVALPMRAFAFIDIPTLPGSGTPAKCFVDASPQKPGNPDSHMGLYLSVTCDDKYKSALGLDVVANECYLLAFQGEHMTGEVQAGVKVDCLKTIVTATQQLIEFTKAGGNAAEQLGFWTSTGGSSAAPGTTGGTTSGGTTSGGTAPTPVVSTAPSGSGTATETYTPPPGALDDFKVAPGDGRFHCGSDTAGKPAVKLSIDLGCKGKDPAILDLMFAIIRLLSTGVGIVIVASTIVAGIQYTASRGNPQEVEKAQERIRSNIIALAIFIFTFAILNWLVPAGLLQ